MTLAVAGATTSRSDSMARATCSIASSDSGSKMSVTTGRCVMARNVSGVTNRAAPLVKATLTRAPACVSLLARSTAL